MKTITKIARAELMMQEGYKLGDFTLKFIGYEDYRSESTKSRNSVLAKFEVYALDGEYSTKPEMIHSFTLFDYGFVTPKGYKSSKKVPVKVVDSENLTLEEVNALKQFKSEYKINSYDPFYHENEAKRRNASAWNYIAANYITDPHCTR